MEDRAPLLFWLEIDVVLGIEEAGPVCAIVRTTNLTDNVGNLGNEALLDAHLSRYGDFIGPGRVPANQGPDCSFVQ